MSDLDAIGWPSRPRRENDVAGIVATDGSFWRQGSDVLNVIGEWLLHHLVDSDTDASVWHGDKVLKP
jgi:hypothetical protein